MPEISISQKDYDVLLDIQDYLNKGLPCGCEDSIEKILHRIIHGCAQQLKKEQKGEN
jgi:hypothetical protein